MSSEDVIDQLELSDLQKAFLRDRWQDQLDWFDRAATKNRRRHLYLRFTTIVSGAITTSLAGLKVAGNTLPEVDWVICFLSLMITITAGLEELMQYGNKWRGYRRLSEELRSEGWKFMELSGNYVSYNRHSDAYREFVTRVEDIIFDSADISRKQGDSR